MPIISNVFLLFPVLAFVCFFVSEAIYVAEAGLKLTIPLCQPPEYSGR
jgi:hypothetical protein